MPGQQFIKYNELFELVRRMRQAIVNSHPDASFNGLKVYAVPSGGVPVALALAGMMVIRIVETPVEADIIVDDLIDSGATMQRPEFKGKPFFALIDKRTWKYGDDWVVWPWETTAEKGIEDHIRRLIQFAGDDPTREGLLETPTRVAKAWEFWGSGYEQDIEAILKTFEDGAEGCDEMVVVKDIPFYTHCEHHLAPFFGTATIGYLPNSKIVGLSKLSRVLKVFARRLQVQERLTTQVADALVKGLAPKGVGVLVKARHLCMESRGVCEQGHHTVTSAMRGVFREEPSARAEFLALARQ
jgi:GTP cyclohydrolase I